MDALRRLTGGAGSSGSRSSGAAASELLTQLEAVQAAVAGGAATAPLHVSVEQLQETTRALVSLVVDVATQRSWERHGSQQPDPGSAAAAAAAEAVGGAPSSSTAAEADAEAALTTKRPRRAAAAAAAAGILGTSVTSKQQGRFQWLGSPELESFNAAVEELGGIFRAAVRCWGRLLPC